MFSLKNGFSATSFRPGKSPVPLAHISLPTGPEIQRTNFQAASLFWAWLVTVLREPRTTVPVVIPLGRGAMSYLRFVFSFFWMAMPQGPSNIMAMLPVAKLARFSFSPLRQHAGHRHLVLVDQVHVPLDRLHARRAVEDGLVGLRRR